MERGHNPLAAAAVATLERLARMFQNVCFTEDLPPVQWSVLRFLSRAEARARSVSGVAAYSGVNHSSASRTVAALVGKGLVEVSACDDGDRRKRIDLTQDGWCLLGSDPLNHLIASVGDIPATDLIALRRLSEELMSRLSSRQGATSSAPDAPCLPVKFQGAGGVEVPSPRTSAAIGASAVPFGTTTASGAAKRTVRLLPYPPQMAVD